MSSDLIGFGSGQGELRCSFCGKPQAMVRKLIAGPNVFICDECVRLCEDFIRQDLDEDAEGAEPTPIDLPTPQ